MIAYEVVPSIWEFKGEFGEGQNFWLMGGSTGIVWFGFLAEF